MPNWSYTKKNVNKNANKIDTKKYAHKKQHTKKDAYNPTISLQKINTKKNAYLFTYTFFYVKNQ